MYNLPKTFAQICALLADIPGVEIICSGLEDANGRIDMLVTGETTVLALQHMAMGANVSLQPWLRQADIESLSSQTIRQTLVASTVRRDHFKFGELQMLGVWLVWYLHRTGTLTTEAANVQLHYWQGAPVGA